MMSKGIPSHTDTHTHLNEQLSTERVVVLIGEDLRELVEDAYVLSRHLVPRPLEPVDSVTLQR